MKERPGSGAPVDHPRLSWPKSAQMAAESQKSDRYNAREAEPRWQKTWDERAIFATKNDDPREKYYVLEMFPYPSGRIHMGHVRNYTMGDVVARYKRARGFDEVVRQLSLDGCFHGIE